MFVQSLKNNMHFRKLSLLNLDMGRLQFPLPMMFMSMDEMNKSQYLMQYVHRGKLPGPRNSKSVQNSLLQGRG